MYRLTPLRRLGRAIVFALGLVLFVAAPVWAHGGAHDDAASVWSHWNWLTLAALAVAGLFYGIGAWRWSRRSAQGISRMRIAAGSGGLLALAIALASPLEAFAGQLFWAHMVQHLLLMVVAAPLLVWGAPPPLLAWSLPTRLRRPVLTRTHRFPGWSVFWAALALPWVAWGVQSFLLWVWHVPEMYQWALENETVHVIEHICFLGSALLFWWVAIRALALSHGRTFASGAAILVAFATAAHSGLLGSLLAFSTTPWVPRYVETASAWGLSSLDDQRLAGLIMWVPAGMVYLAAAVALLMALLREAPGEAAETVQVEPPLGNLQDALQREPTRAETVAR